MKKLLVVAAALMLIVPAMSNAQGISMTQAEFNKKGKISLSGNLLSFNNIKNEDADEGPTTYGIAPSVGYMVMDNIQVNLGLGYGSTEEGDTTVTMWGVTPGVRYYFDMLSKNNLFPSVGASYTMGNMTADLGMGEAKTDMSEIRVGAGMTQAMGGAQGGYLTLNIDYAMQTTTPDGGDDANSAGIDMSVGFGLYF